MRFAADMLAPQAIVGARRVGVSRAGLRVAGTTFTHVAHHRSVRLYRDQAVRPMMYLR